MNKEPEYMVPAESQAPVPPDKVLFTKRIIGGYDPREVDQAVDALEANVQELTGQLAACAEKLREVCKDNQDLEARRIEEQLQIVQVMTDARRDKERIVASAKQEADQLLRQARAEAETLLTDARHKAGRTAEDAGREAEKLRLQTSADLRQMEIAIREIAGYALPIKQALAQLFQDVEERVFRTFSDVTVRLSETGKPDRQSAGTQESGTQPPDFLREPQADTSAGREDVPVT